jgi:hypothetical protein
MPTTRTRPTLVPNGAAAPSQSTAMTALHLFDALGALHTLRVDDAELLRRAASGLRFIRSTSVFTEADDALFQVALADLSDRDAFVVETAARYAADLVPNFSGTRADPGRGRDRAALWLAAILRLADGVCPNGSNVARNVYATWTDEVLYLEFDGTGISGDRLARAMGRVTALEALTGRRVVLANADTRRGAA